jgi:hypothetical protein
MSDINISSATIREQEAKLSRLESELAVKQQEVAAVKRWLDAARVLSSPFPPPRQINGTLLLEEPPPFSGPNKSMTLAIERIANNSPAPVSKDDLRRQLAELGYPQEQLKGYFYTALMRLRDKNRMTVMEDGSIWRKAPK